MKFLSQIKKSGALTFTLSLILLILALVLGVALGSTHIPLSRIISAIFGVGDITDVNVIRFVRLPRALGSILCGGALALSGAVIQGALGNRLASPSIIGVNAGAGLFVTAACAFGIAGGWRISLLAFLGALAAALTVSLVSKRLGASEGTVILMGVAMNSLLGALSDVLVTVSPDVSILSNDFRIGGFSAVTYQRLAPASIMILGSAALLLTLSSELELLSLGDEHARGLGLNASLSRTLLLILASVLAGAAVSVCGTLSFVGLLVPHAVRRLSSGGTRRQLLLCFILGGGFVSLCDTLSRRLFSPYEIPVGIIMAFLGAPFFLYILFRRERCRNA